MSRSDGKKSYFGLGLAIYFIIGCIGIFFFLRWFNGYLTAYETSLPSNGIADVKEAFETGAIENVMRGDNLVTSSTYYNVFDYEAHIKELIVGKEITIEESSQSSAEVPRYVIKAAGEPVTDVTLKVIGQNDYDMDIWGCDMFYPDEYCMSTDVYTITVPSDVSVSVSGRTLTSDDIMKDESGNPVVKGIDLIQGVTSYMTYVPTFTTYQISGLWSNPVVEAMSPAGEPVELTCEGTNYSAPLQTDADVMAEINAIIPTIVEAYGKHFIGVNSGAVYNYLLPDSEYRASLSTAMTNFYPTSHITSYDYYNVSADNFVTYCDNCVSANITFDLIVKFNSAAYQTKNEGSDAVWVFVKQNGTWYLADVPRQEPRSLEDAGITD
ncbi:MAG: hypothetical protein J6Y12_02505 [Lachnospiraceae bacterium]|nr:hypothetical protein [Lachnospiraceae bacterium]MBP5762601.1 hypothetical protein [Lachnospiraceae bacterium]